MAALDSKALNYYKNIADSVNRDIDSTQLGLRESRFQGTHNLDHPIEKF